MIKEKIEEAINDQINAELYSAYLYLSIAADFGDKNLEGFANWMRIQAQEEVEHAIRLYDYLEERGGRVKLKAIDKPKTEWESPHKAFKDAYEHEQYITGRINDLVDLAEKEKDKATVKMLQWFVEEQVEEENSVNKIVQKLEMAKDSTSSLLMIDSQLGERVLNEIEDDGDNDE